MDELLFVWQSKGFQPTKISFVEEKKFNQSPNQTKFYEYFYLSAVFYSTNSNMYNWNPLERTISLEQIAPFLLCVLQINFKLSQQNRQTRSQERKGENCISGMFVYIMLHISIHWWYFAIHDSMMVKIESNTQKKNYGSSFFTHWCNCYVITVGVFAYRYTENLFIILELRL